MSEGDRVVAERADLNAVREFWDRQPLFTGVSRHPPGDRGFFEEHARAVRHHQAGELLPIYFRGVQPGARVLDVGCGIGFWVHEFCLRGAVVSACDLAPSAVRLTRERSALFGLQADVREGNAEALPYGDASFDHINCQGVIHHTPDPQRCVEEFHRVLRPGGTLCFSVYFKILPLRWRPLFRAVVRLARPWVRIGGRGREGMLTAATPEELVRLYDGAGNPLGRAFTRAEVRRMLTGHFQILEETRFGIPRSAFHLRLSDGVYRFLSRRFGLMLVVRCRKPGGTG